MSDNVIRLLYFVILILPNWLSFHWLWVLTCQSAGVTKHEVWQYRSKVSHQPRPPKHVTRWLIRHSPNPKKTKTLMLIYLFGIVPMVSCVSLAIFGLYSSAFDNTLHYASIIMPCIIAIAAVAGLVYKTTSKKDIVNLPEMKKTLAGDRKFVASMMHTEEIDKFKKANTGNKIKMILISIVKVALAIGLLVGLFLLINNIGTPKTPATAQQVWDVCTTQGYQPYDTTQDYCQAWEADAVLTKAVTIQKDNIHFNFFTLDSDKSALRLQQQYVSYIRLNRYSTPNVEFEERMANYSIYTLKANENYTVLMRVDSTVVYAYSGEESANAIRAIMVAIGYFDE